MNKSLLFILLIVLAGGIMWTADYFSSVPPSDKIDLGGIVQEPKVVRDFKAFCDTLSKSKWDQAEFQERIDRLNVYRTQNIVNATEFLNLEEYMYSSYATSLISSYKEWKQSCDEIKLNPMYIELKRISSFNSGCANKLKAYKKEINSFYALLVMPNKINQFTRGSYSENRFNQLKKEIAALPNDFSSCRNVNHIKQDSENKLNTFSRFVVNFNDAMKAYQVDSTDSYTLRDLKRLLEKANKEKYSYYVPQFKDKNVFN